MQNFKSWSIFSKIDISLKSAQPIGSQSPISNFSSGTSRSRFFNFFKKKYIPYRFYDEIHFEDSGYHRDVKSTDIEKPILIYRVNRLWYGSFIGYSEISNFNPQMKYFHKKVNFRFFKNAFFGGYDLENWVSEKLALWICPILWNRVKMINTQLSLTFFH